MSALIVAGTHRGVGKTVVTAAIAALAARAGRRVAAVKLAQTATPPGRPGDTARIASLAGLDDVHEFARYPASAVPYRAAQLAGTSGPAFAATARRIDDLAAARDLVLVEGTDGLASPFDDGDRWTLLDLAADLHCPIVLVVDAAQPDLTLLTRQRLEDERIEVAGVVIGHWPDVPTERHRTGVHDLAGAAGPLRGALASADRTAAGFRRQARQGLGRAWGGLFSARAFVAAHAPG